MHQCDQRMSDAQRLRRLGQHTKCQPIDHDRAAFRHIPKVRVRGGACQRGRVRKSLTEIEDFRPPAKFAQFGDHTPIIGIAAGRSVEIARHRENEIALHHKGASYHARAFGDSATVTRNAKISRGARPSLSPFSAAAN